ncbi:DUF3868 domain-containing protein [Palleniella muris]|uniref:DUF3868 domain-containing protein n=1 Tax=Palleniella muris TaxID=3038145 RepID=A0AC61QR70_9BACT|nr:DUF3868 domain-containing protein [Palleniella muris]TGX82510.1 DUF3868 domain-containing protein [Palleniella muris]
MDKILFTSLAAMLSLGSVCAKDVVDNVSVSSMKMDREGRFLSVDMTMGLAALNVESNQCVLLTPWLVNGSDSVALPSVAVYGRRRYYYYLRNNGGAMMSGSTEKAFMAKDKPQTVAYRELLPYEEWMDGATLRLRRVDEGCCQKVLLDEYGAIGKYSGKFFPDLVYIKPEGTIEKRRSLEGRAYIDFPVDRTEIHPEYRRNTIELAAIRSTIDTIRNDSDARIDTVWLKGYASPESPYSHNRDLAVGRTKSLKDYLMQLYKFDGVTMLTDHEPEDWEGLRKAVAESNLTHRSEILELIAAKMNPDLKEARIKRLYPADYKFMLAHFYPALRHTDYRVSYVIRSYNDPHQILEVMKKSPQKLGQNEFYVAAGILTPGTEEFTEVFETAVKMFPDDPVANLNAASAAIRRGNLDMAEKYLLKAGDSPEALYTRGAVAVRRKDYAAARRYLGEAKQAGLVQAGRTLEELEERLGDR